MAFLSMGMFTLDSNRDQFPGSSAWCEANDSLLQFFLGVALERLVLLFLSLELRLVILDALLQRLLILRKQSHL